jgi:hypothetical protein
MTFKGEFSSFDEKRKFCKKEAQTHESSYMTGGKEFY